MRHLDLATLRSLVAIDETGGVTRAANRLHLSQSAVSMQVKRLEELLSIRILERDGRQVRFTPEGEQLVIGAREMLEINDGIVDRLTTPRFEGNLNVGIPYDIVHPHIPHVLRRFGREYPRVSVRLTTDFTVALKADMREGRFDVILSTERQPTRGGEVLLKQPLVWSGAPDARAWRQRPLPVVFSAHCIFRKPALTALRAAGIEYLEAVKSSSEDAALVACAADLGVSADLTVGQHQGIAPIDHGGTLPELPEYCVALYVPSGENEELGRIFGDMLRESYSNLPLAQAA